MKAEEAERFTAVYEQNLPRVYGFFGYRVGSREAAEDLSQQTFEKALKSWRLFDPQRASAATWVMAIARNVLIDNLRKRGRTEPEAPIEEAEATVGVMDRPDLGLSPELAAALDKLGPRQRELIALRFGGDLTGREIADLTGMSLANVQQILSRSLRRLRSELAPQLRAERSDAG